MKAHSKSIFSIPLSTALVASLLGSVLVVTPARADSTIAVNTTADQDNTDISHCALREAIIAANTNAAYGGCAAGTGADTITLPAGTYQLTIAGTGEFDGHEGDLNVNDALTINGAGSATTIIEAGATPGSGIDRVMTTTPSAAVNISGVTIANGTCASCLGGGIYNGSSSTLNVTGSAFTSNSASVGGGLYSVGTANVTKSTFSGNSAIHGAGMFNGGALAVTNSTFSGNTASDMGGGLYNGVGSTTMRNSTFAANSSVNEGGGILNQALLNLTNTILADSTSGVDCYNASGTIGTDVRNLVETMGSAAAACGTPYLTADPVLDSALAYNGGTTPNLALLAGSPALEAGDDTTCTSAPVNSTSQNGRSRPQGTHCDIGAHEAPFTIKATFKSAAGQDGWVLESSESSNLGGSMNSATTSLRMGDDASRKQYRGVLSFATGAALPDDAAITKVTLRVKWFGVTGGGNPVSIFQGFMADIKRGTLGTSALELGDFQAAATSSYGPFNTSLSNGWYRINLTPGKGRINKLASGGGLTQIRLRFQNDDNNDALANYLSLYSGDAGSAAQPQLIIEYNVP